MSEHNRQSYLVATDLDGTLLDHFSYSWEAALPSLQHLAARAVPVVLNTSKTYSEVVELREQLGLDAPFIVENGSAIYSPAADNPVAPFERIVCGCERSAITSYLHDLREESGWQFEGYSDWDTQQIIDHTALDEDSARKSQAREFSEPLLWQDSAANFELFSAAIADSPFRLLHGGRFVHVLGKTDKGSALRQLQSSRADYRERTLVCLGDSGNDLDMLDVADIPVLVRSPVHEFPHYTGNARAIFTEQCGPAGWHEALTDIINKQDT